MSFSNFIKELNGDGVEGELIKTAFYSILTSAIVLLVLWYFKFRAIEGFLGKYGLFLFFVALSYALIVPAIRQVRAYKEFPCMSGMMIGMTTGMIAGFLPGFYVASTNGMFVGSVFGMAVGILFGIWNGKCCGIMGAMEGTMAGFMGGLMGAMTAFMLLNDHLRETAVIVFAVSAVIMIGLNYMIFKETRETQRQRKDDYFITIFITFILLVVTTWLMIYGPRSLLFQ